MAPCIIEKKLGLDTSGNLQNTLPTTHNLSSLWPVLVLLWFSSADISFYQEVRKYSFPDYSLPYHQSYKVIGVMNCVEIQLKSAVT